MYYTELYGDCSDYYINFIKIYWAQNIVDINNKKTLDYIQNRQIILENLMKEQNTRYAQLNTPEHPLLFAIYNLAHPEFINFLKNNVFNGNKLKIISNTYDKMIDIYDKKTELLDINLAIKDILKWMYIDIIYNKGCFRKYESHSNKFYIRLFDKYAEIFGIEYEKINYD